LTLAHGLREKAEAPIFGPTVIHGLADTLRLAVEESRTEAARGLSSLLESPPGDLAEWDTWLEAFERGALELAGLGPGRTVEQPPSARESEPAAVAPDAVESLTWAGRLVDQVRSWRSELAAAAPWLDALLAWEVWGDPHWGSEAAGRRWAEVRAR